MTSRYRILVAGVLTASDRDVFAGLEVSTERATTVISGDLDQAALHGLFDRVRSLGLELVEVRRMAATCYEVSVLGTLGPAFRHAFADMVVDVEPATTVLSGEMEQAALYVLLDRVRALGLELVEVRQVDRPSSVGVGH